MRLDREEPGRVPAGVLAVLVHLVFIGVLVFGVSWQNREASPVVAELWNSLPSPASKVASRPEPAPKPEVKPEPRPEPKPEPKPVVKPEPKPEPKPVKADIELKDKEKEKKLKEEQKKAEEQKRLREELKREQQELLKQEQQQRDLQRQQQEAANALARQQASARQREIDGYIGKIRDKIKRYIVVPPDVPGNPQAEFDVTLMPTGEVLNVKLTRSSGNPAYDSAVERAIYKAQPLPLPPDASLFSRFRELQLKFRLNE